MKISIVTPTWNQSDFIERTIESVINQEGDFELEYIIMDGSSTDGTVNILKKYDKLIKKNSRYKHISFIWKSEKDKGQSDAINKGMRLAKGEVVAFLNSDDTYTQGTLQKVSQVFKNNPDLNWVFGKCMIIDERDCEIRKPITWYKNFLLSIHSVPLLLSENYISQPATFWKRSIMEEIGFFDESEHMVMDYEYWLRIVSKFGDGFFLDDYLAKFRYYNSSKSGSRFIEQFTSELRIAKKYGKNYPLSIILHYFNTYKIIGTYSVMGFVKKLINK